MTVQDVKGFLEKHPGYLKKSPLVLATRVGTTVDIAREAQVEVKSERTRDTRTETTTEISDDYEWQNDPNFDRYCEHRGIDQSKITGVKYWQDGAGRPRYSVATDPKMLTLKEQIDLFKGHMEDFTPPEFVYDTLGLPTTERVDIVNLYDAHIDKLCLLDEGAYFDSTLEKHVAIFEHGFDMALKKIISKGAPELIIMPLGNDFWTDNGTGATKAGTPQRTTVPNEVSYVVGIDVIIRCIEKAKLIAPVYCPWIKANHDTDKAFYASDCIRRLYENDPRVVIEATRKEHKFFRYGSVALGFAHGHNQAKNLDRVPLVMAEEAKQTWANTRIREFFLGDKHSGREYRFHRMWDGIGVRINYLRSIVPNDMWESDHTYFGMFKTVEVVSFTKDGVWRDNWTYHWQVDHEKDNPTSYSQTEVDFDHLFPTL